MAQLVGVKIVNGVLLTEFFKIPGRALRVHRLWTVVLGKNKLADRCLCLYYLELSQQCHNIRANIHSASLAVFGSSHKDPFCRGVLEIVSDGNSATPEINVRPLEAARLTAPDAGISK